MRSWQAIAAGEVSAAITGDGDLYRWGRTNFSSSSGGSQLTPLLVSKPSTVSRWLYVATGDYNFTPVAIADDGNLYQCDPFVSRVIPKPEGVTSWLKVTTGRTYYLALADTGELFEWEPPVSGEIAPRKVALPERPPRVTRWITRWLNVSSSVTHRFALGDDGELYRWDSQAPTPARVPRPANVTCWKSISAGMNLSAAIGSDNRLYVWQSAGAQLFTSPPPGKWISVAAGSDALLLIGDDCLLYAVGNNTWGQLGTGNTTTYHGTPVPVKNLEHLCLPSLPPTEPGTLTLAPLHPLFQREREFRFHVLGNAAEPFVLLRSPDLKNWLPLSTNPPVTGWRTLSDTNLQNATSLFYRVATP